MMKGEKQITQVKPEDTLAVIREDQLTNVEVATREKILAVVIVEIRVKVGAVIEDIIKTGGEDVAMAIRELIPIQARQKALSKISQLKMEMKPPIQTGEHRETASIQGPHVVAAKINSVSVENTEVEEEHAAMMQLEEKEELIVETEVIVAHSEVREDNAVIIEAAVDNMVRMRSTIQPKEKVNIHYQLMKI